MNNIVDFNKIRIFNPSNPISTGLELFEDGIDITTYEDKLFIDKVIITNSGSEYTPNASIVFTMISGDVISSASAFFTIEDVTNSGSGSLYSVQLTNAGIFSLNSRISGSISDISGNGGAVFISTTRSKKINSFLTNPPVYDSFEAVKDKIRLVLYTKKGEVPRSGLGTRIYENLLNFDQIISDQDFIEKIGNILIDDITSQIPEIEILEIINNESETDLNKNKIGISITFRHKLQKKTDKIDLNVRDDRLNLIRERYINESGDARPIRYFDRRI